MSGGGNFICRICYCPQTKFAKVIFLHPVVCSMGGERRSLASQHAPGRELAYHHAPGRWVCFPAYIGKGGFCIQGGLPTRGGRLHPWGSPSGEQCASGGIGLTGGGVDPPGLNTGELGQTPFPRYMGYYGIRSTSGRYPSYWNEFLFINIVASTVLTLRKHYIQWPF